MTGDVEYWDVIDFVDSTCIHILSSLIDLLFFLANHKPTTHPTLAIVFKLGSEWGRGVKNCACADPRAPRPAAMSTMVVMFCDLCSAMRIVVM